jgi:hypothetical protein
MAILIARETLNAQTEVKHRAGPADTEAGKERPGAIHRG